ncbi:MAG: hypothetical protein OEQ13_11345 [Acidobacteriota bacterium]|nr:hypothetical protein [Acidobacteriota bacterium]
MSPGTAVADEVTYRYRLEAADGIPADYRISLPVVNAGTWRVRASWDGRGIGGLWLLEADGDVLLKRVAASPLEIAFQVDEARAESGDDIVIRFASTTDRGEMFGELAVTPPGTASGAEAATPKQDDAAGLSGPGRCLAPGFDEGPVGRALRRLASSLETSSDDETKWCLSWVREVVGVLEREDDFRERRGAVDGLWERLLIDRARGAPVDDAVRELLSTVEELVRREGIAKDPSVVRRRQHELIELLSGCL